jgi:hypothetical protein
MKQNKTAKDSSVSEPILKDLVERHQVETKQVMAQVLIGKEPLKPAALYQNDGGAYSNNFTFPQK